MPFLALCSLNYTTPTGLLVFIWNASKKVKNDARADAPRSAGLRLWKQALDGVIGVGYPIEWAQIAQPRFGQKPGKGAMGSAEGGCDCCADCSPCLECKETKRSFVQTAYFRFRDAKHGFDTGIAAAEEMHSHTSLPRRYNNHLWGHFVLRGSHNECVHLSFLFCFCLFSYALRGCSRTVHQNLADERENPARRRL